MILILELDFMPTNGHVLWQNLKRFQCRQTVPYCLDSFCSVTWNFLEYASTHKYIVLDCRSLILPLWRGFLSSFSILRQRLKLRKDTDTEDTDAEYGTDGLNHRRIE